MAKNSYQYEKRKRELDKKKKKEEKLQKKLMRHAEGSDGMTDEAGISESEEGIGGENPSESAETQNGDSSSL